MKTLHRIAIALGVAEVAVVAAAARRHAVHTAPHRPHGCHPSGPGARGLHVPQHGRHRRPEHPEPGDRPSPGRERPPFADGGHGGPPPWMRARLAAWHEAQHADHPPHRPHDLDDDPGGSDDDA